MHHTSKGHKNTHNPLQLEVGSQQRRPFMDNVYWFNWSQRNLLITSRGTITSSIKRFKSS